MTREVSVIIPTYNRAHLIGEAILSVMNQDIEDCKLEIIVVDDGSVDETRQVVCALGQGVKYIYQENQGVGAARNRGIKESSGDWLAFLDSDDLWLPDKLSLQFKILDIFPQFKVIHSNFYTFSGNEIIISKGLEYWTAEFIGGDVGDIDWNKFYTNKFNSNEYGISRSGLSFNIYSGNIFSELLRSVCANCWTSLIHKDCFGADIRFSRLPIVEDYWFYCKLSEKYDVLFIDCPTVENRAHSGQRESQGKKEVLMEQLRYLYKKIYLPSLSLHRPPDGAINGRLRNINSKLLIEYLKNGKLLQAKSFYFKADKNRELENNLIKLIFFLIVNIPFNIVSRLVILKRWFYSIGQILVLFFELDESCHFFN